MAENKRNPFLPDTEGTVDKIKSTMEDAVSRMKKESKVIFENMKRLSDKVRDVIPSGVVPGMEKMTKERREELKRFRQSLVGLTLKFENSLALIADSIDTLREQGVPEATIQALSDKITDSRVLGTVDKIKSKEEITKKEAQLLVDSLRDTTSIMEGLDAQFKVTFNSLIENVKDLTNDDRIQPELIKESLNNLESTIRGELGEEATPEQKKSLDNLSMFMKDNAEVTKENTEELRALLNDLANNTQEEKMVGSLRRLSGFAESQYISSKKVEELLETQTSQGAFLKDFLENAKDFSTEGSSNMLDIVGNLIGLGPLGQVVGTVTGVLSGVFSGGKALGKGLWTMVKWIGKLPFKGLFGVLSKAAGVIGKILPAAGKAALAFKGVALVAAGFAGFKFGEWLMQTELGKAFQASDIYQKITGAIDGILDGLTGSSIGKALGLDNLLGKKVISDEDAMAEAQKLDNKARELKDSGKFKTITEARRYLTSNPAELKAEAPTVRKTDTPLSTLKENKKQQATSIDGKDAMSTPSDKKMKESVAPRMQPIVIPQQSAPQSPGRSTTRMVPSKSMEISVLTLAVANQLG